MTLIPAETELVGRAREGDAAAYGELYRRSWGSLYAFVAARVRDPDEAASLTQETFVRAWKSIAMLREPAAWGGFLRTIAARTLARAPSASGKTPASLDAAALDRADPRAVDPHRAAERAEFERALFAALDEFAPVHREALLLRLVEGLRYREIGERLGLSLDQVKGIIARGLVRLTERLGPFLEEAAG